jgi:YVTN family beta-propeller protein
MNNNNKSNVQKEHIHKLSNNLGNKIVEPFIGPRPFSRTEEDQKRFFGRDNESGEIVSLIASHKLVLIYAQSGAGKTSIFNAKVIPQLEQYGFEVLPVTRIKSFQITNYNVSSENLDTDKDIKNVYIFNVLQNLKPELNPTLFKDKSLSQFLKECFPVNENKNNKQQILIFDQFEEIFDLFPFDWKKQRIDFFKQIAESLNCIASLQIVFVMREDYLAQLDPYSNLLPEKLRPRFRLEKLREGSALLAIKGPIQNVPNHFLKQIEDTDKNLKNILHDLMKIQTEYSPGKSHQIEGEFVEPIQLQVVFQRWWEKIIKSNDKNFKEKKIDVTDVDNALEDFFENIINEIIKKTGISESKIRNWFEEKLITSSGTRNVVPRSIESTAGIKNDVIEILKNKYLLKENLIANSKWYELTHDRLIKPIRISNSKWKKKFEKRKKIKIMAIAIPLAISVVIIFTWYNSWHNDQYVIPTAESISVENLPYLSSIDQDSGKIFITHPKSDVISIINGKRNDVIKNLKVTNEPTDIAVDSKNNLVYVSHLYNKTISVLEESSGNFKKGINVGYFPFSLDINSRTAKLYVTSYNSTVVSVIDTINDTILNNIQVGKGPTGITVDEKNNLVYVANSQNNSISVINGITDEVETTIPVGKGPTDIAVNSKNNKVYVANYLDNTVSVINKTNNTLIKPPIKVGINPTSIKIDPIRNKIYVTNSGDKTVSIINTDKNLDNVVAILNVGNKPTSININLNQNILYIVNNADHNIQSIDIDAKKIPTNIHSMVPVGIHPSGIAIDNTTRLIYVANTDSDTVSVINGTTNMKINEFGVGKKPNGIDISHKNSSIYISNSFSDSVSVIHHKKGSLNNTVIYEIPTQGKYPTGLSINDKNNIVYVANTDSDTVSVINGTSKKVISIIPVDDGPTGITVDEKNNKVYVANNHADTVSIIDSITNAVETTIPVGKGPTDIAVDERNNLIYVSNYENDTLSVIDRASFDLYGNISINKYHFGSGNGPTSILVDSNNNKIYVLNVFSNDLSIIDIDIIKDDLKEQGGINTNSKYVITSLSNIGNSPKDISLDIDTKTIYITDRNDNVTKILDLPIQKTNVEM